LHVTFDGAFCELCDPHNHYLLEKNNFDLEGSRMDIPNINSL